MLVDTHPHIGDILSDRREMLNATEPIVKRSAFMRNTPTLTMQRIPWMAAFTLVELSVVIAIIAILAANRAHYFSSLWPSRFNSHEMELPRAGAYEDVLPKFIHRDFLKLI